VEVAALANGRALVTAAAVTAVTDRAKPTPLATVGEVATAAARVRAARSALDAFVAADELRTRPMPRTSTGASVEVAALANGRALVTAAAVALETARASATALDSESDAAEETDSDLPIANAPSVGAVVDPADSCTGVLTPGTAGIPCHRSAGSGSGMIRAIAWRGATGIPSRSPFHRRPGPDATR
jgi:hypothetical protein